MEKIKRAVLHNTLLLGGSNLQLSLDTEKRTGLQMIHDADADVLYVHNNGEYATLPYPNVAHMVPQDPSKLASLFKSTFGAKEKTVEKQKPLTNTPIKAQASGPMDHVHNGLGAGKLRD